MISSIGKWLTRTLLTNPRIKDKVAANNHIMCVLFNLAHPDWLFARLTEKLSPWLGASEYRNIPIQIQRVYSPLYGSWGWCARVLHPDLGWCNLGSVHDDLKIAFEHADLHIDEIMDETLIERIKRVVEAKERRKKKTLSQERCPIIRAAQRARFSRPVNNLGR